MDCGYFVQNSRNTLTALLQVFAVAAALIGVLIIVGVAVGVTVTKKKPSSAASSGGSGSSSPSSSVNQTNPNDPSTFVKDPNLKQSFYGLAYTPLNSQLPNCGSKLCVCIAPFSHCHAF